MSSNRTAGSRFRQALPWIAWVAAGGTALGFYLGEGGPTVAPAAVERREASLSALRDARVASVEVKRGDRVRAGQVLVRLDPAELDAELAVARAELERLALDVDSRGLLLTDERRATADRLASQSERATLELARLESDQKRDVGELAQLDEQIAREQRLVADHLASADSLNKLQLVRAALSQKVTESEATLQVAKRSRDASARRLQDWMQAEPKAAAAATDPRVAGQLAPRRAAVNAQKERCRLLEIQRESLELTAPFDGQVGVVTTVKGEVARTGRSMVTVVDEHPTGVVAYLDQAWASKVRPGDEVTLVPSDGAGPPRKGRVSALGPEITELPERFRPIPNRPTWCREAYVELDPAAASPLPGQAFSASFRPGEGAPSKTVVGER